MNAINSRRRTTDEKKKNRQQQQIGVYNKRKNIKIPCVAMTMQTVQQ